MLLLIKLSTSQNNGELMMTSYAPNDSVGNDATDISLISATTPNRYHLARLFRKRNMKQVSEVLKTLLDDSTPASAASVAIAQVDAVANVNANVQGGVRGVTSNEIMDASLVNQPDASNPNTARNVAAADVTELQKDLFGGSNTNRAPTTYPVDKSGNGGGGKLG
jgi:hypothetical protein